LNDGDGDDYEGDYLDGDDDDDDDGGDNNDNNDNDDNDDRDQLLIVIYMIIII
jgi:hypothetical protein